MSKSLGNTIGLFEEPEAIWEKLKPAKTDPARKRKIDPGNPDVCNVFTIHKGFSPAATQAEVARNCRTAAWGCLDCKRVLFEHMNAELTPIRRRAQDLRNDPGAVNAVLGQGAVHAKAVAHQTMAHVKEAMGLG
jgi:tryptophanyl-tRNA synthetase